MNKEKQFCSSFLIIIHSANISVVCERLSIPHGAPQRGNKLPAQGKVN